MVQDMLLLAAWLRGKALLAAVLLVLLPAGQREQARISHRL
jgi:hypothetical protein